MEGKPDDKPVEWEKNVKPKLWVPAPNPFDKTSSPAPQSKTVKQLKAKGAELVQVGPCFLLASALNIKTMAERMLETAENFNRQPRDRLIIAGEGTGAFDVEFTAVCLKFARLPASTRLRAMVEKWDYNRIVQETHQ